jgi:hypothetical protein
MELSLKLNRKRHGMDLSKRFRNYGNYHCGFQFGFRSHFGDKAID